MAPSFLTVSLFKNRKTLVVFVMIVMLILFVMVLMSGPKLTQHDSKTHQSAEGVLFMGVPVGNMTEEELYDVVKEYQEHVERTPQDAYLDPVTGGVIPGLPGEALNVTKTIEEIMGADKNEEVMPVIETNQPDVTLEDYKNAPVYQGNPSKQQAAIIINVAWGAEYVEGLLNVFEKHDVKVSFFFEGNWAQNHSELVEKAHQSAHDIGNHGYNHLNLSEVDRETVKEEILQTNSVLEEITGDVPKLFGPPAGDFDETVLEEAAQHNMTTILWSLDTVDWRKPGVSNMVDKIVNNIHPGALILAHPTEDTIQALDIIIEELKNLNYQIVPISELLDEG